MKEFLKDADLIAPEGMIYTNGSDVFATKIWLGEGAKKEDFKLISEAEYEKLLEEVTIE